MRLDAGFHMTKNLWKIRNNKDAEFWATFWALNFLSGPHSRGNKQDLLRSQLIRTLLRDNPHPKGNHYFRLDASELDGGLYVLRLQGDGIMETRKMVVVRWKR